jgi:tRNA-5-methyluridine54 2-sulfurtransferase
MRVRLRNPDRDVEVAGPLPVADLLDHLDILPHTVLVLSDGELVTAAHVLARRRRGGDPSGDLRRGGGRPRCVVCRAPRCSRSAATARRGAPPTSSTTSTTRSARRSTTRRAARRGAHVLLRRPPAGRGLRGQGLAGAVGRAARHGLPGRRAVRRAGHRRLLGRSQEVCERFAASGASPARGRPRRGPTATPPRAGAARPAAPTCGVCGLSKRYAFNRVAVDHGYDVVVTGHNLDDEAATLLGNVLRWQDGFLARQRPVLPATGANQVRKIKPLYRLSERETAAYCVVRGIDYVVEECPLVDGNTGHELKEAFDLLEARLAGAQGPVPVRLLRPPERLVDAGRGRGHAVRECSGAGCRPPGSCAPSAGSGSASWPRCRSPGCRARRRGGRVERRAERPRSPVLPGTDAPLARRRAGAARLTARAGATSSTSSRARVAQPRRAGRPRRPDRAREGTAVRTARHGGHGAAPDPRGRGPQDEARRPGGLPQGPGDDRRPGRHPPGLHRARGRGRAPGR